MVKASTFSRIRLLLSAISIIITFTAFSQTGKSKIQAANNSYGISNNLWIAWQNKTNLLLENVDEQSFINYVIFANDGNLADRTYFLNYVREKIKKDKEELIYRVGKGTISKTEEVKAYFSSLQPKYINYCIVFKKHREVIIETQNTFKAPIDGDPIAFNCGSPCTNPGFESGTGFWDYWSGVACGTSSTDPCNLISGFDSTVHDLTTIGTFDTQVGGTILPVVPPGGGNNAMELGDYSVTGSKASKASISFTVSATNASFTYRYALVLQDPQSGHSDPERPYFRVNVKDQNGNVIPGGSLEIMAKPPLTGFIETATGSAIWYKPWTTVLVPLQAYNGQCVTIEFTSSDCSQGGHFGYAYIDADCSTSEISASPLCAGNAILTAPSGGSAYVWTNVSSGGTTGIIGASTTQTISVNQLATYQVTITTDSLSTLNLSVTVDSILQQPTAISGATTICENTSLSYSIDSVPGAASYTWTLPSGWQGTSTTTSISATPGTLDGTISVTANNACGSSIPQTLNVVINPLPAVSLTSFGSVCDYDSPFTLTGGSPSGGIYYGSGVIYDTIFSPSIATTGLHTLIYTFQDANNCSSSDTTTVQVDVCTGVNVNATTNNVIVYPNPADKNITFLLKKSINLKDTEIFLYDGSGKKVMLISNIDNYEIKIERNLLNSGIYFYKIMDNNQELAKGKLIIH